MKGTEKKPTAKQAYMKAYYQRPEVKAHRKAYRQQPEVKAKQKKINESLQPMTKTKTHPDVA